MAFSPAHNALIIADTVNHRVCILELPPPYMVATICGNGEIGYLPEHCAGPWDIVNVTQAQFFYPQNVAVDASGKHVYVTDSGNGAVRAIDMQNATIRTLNSFTCTQPMTMLLENDAHLLVVSASDGSIFRLAVSATPPSSGLSETLQGQGEVAPPFKGPVGRFWCRILTISCPALVLLSHLVAVLWSDGLFLDNLLLETLDTSCP